MKNMYFIIGKAISPNSLPVVWFLNNLVFLRLSVLVLLFYWIFSIKHSVPYWLQVGLAVTFVGLISLFEVPVSIIQAQSLTFPILSTAVFILVLSFPDDKFYQGIHKPLIIQYWWPEKYMVAKCMIYCEGILIIYFWLSSCTCCYFCTFLCWF